MSAWSLVREGEVVAEILVDGGDFPWMTGVFVERVEGVAEVFSGGSSGSGFRLVDDEGAVGGFYLEVSGGRARFRWWDEDDVG
ncbi:hypothetical protein [Saccharothrix obliqua]|uniref:hypothetical protein n=1 Tax=Saccharothrix obliqua TaxID=2861747 RepID=UPI001C5F9AD6|nr:hypothetical protein [Saccharothrix obliqua]MBW4716722.1 hypothetical protein [Saccharothrix obliqua]